MKGKKLQDMFDTIYYLDHITLNKLKLHPEVEHLSTTTTNSLSPCIRTNNAEQYDASFSDMLHQDLGFRENDKCLRHHMQNKIKL